MIQQPLAGRPYRDRASGARRRLRGHPRRQSRTGPPGGGLPLAAGGQPPATRSPLFRGNADTMSASDFTQRLTQALGPDTVYTADADIAPWLSDWRGLSPPAWPGAGKRACR
ncbi:hypothetical protein G6F62_015477 [Rhizopus arrhizus]|nr:hypothetical protein G6F62_015477 [Rhizopus arrhizus]